MVEPKVFCTNGNHEIFKGTVHGAAVLIAALCATYNIAACFFRRDAHLKVNAVVYTLALGWEMKQTYHHLQSCRVTAEGVTSPVDHVE